MGCATSNDAAEQEPRCATPRDELGFARDHLEDSAEYSGIGIGHPNIYAADVCLPPGSLLHRGEVHPSAAMASAYARELKATRLGNFPSEAESAANAQAMLEAYARQHDAVDAAAVAQLEYSRCPATSWSQSASLQPTPNLSRRTSVAASPNFGLSSPHSRAVAGRLATSASFTRDTSYGSDAAAHANLSASVFDLLESDDDNGSALPVSPHSSRRVLQAPRRSGGSANRLALTSGRLASAAVPESPTSVTSALRFALPSPAQTESASTSHSRVASERRAAWHPHQPALPQAACYASSAARRPPCPIDIGDDDEENALMSGSTRCPRRGLLGDPRLAALDRGAAAPMMRGSTATTGARGASRRSLYLAQHPVASVVSGNVNLRGPNQRYGMLVEPAPSLPVPPVEPSPVPNLIIPSECEAGDADHHYAEIVFPPAVKPAASASSVRQARSLSLEVEDEDIAPLAALGRRLATHVTVDARFC